MRICLVYDHIFPQTVGGAERWMRDLAVAVAAAGHDVTYLTMRHGTHAETPVLAGVRVLGLAGAGRVYAKSAGPSAHPFASVLAVARHLAAHGPSTTSSTPRRSRTSRCSPPECSDGRAGYRLFVDWHEVWTRDYWRAYAGRFAGTVGWLVQRRCIRLRMTRTASRACTQSAS